MVEQNEIKKKELVDVRYVNFDDTELLSFTIYRALGSRRKEYFLEIHKYTNWLYADDFNTKTIYREIRMFHTIKDAIQALRQAIQKHSTNMTIEFLIIDKNLQQRAGITFEEKLEERLEKLFKLT